jgi:hypothetical protein
MLIFEDFDQVGSFVDELLRAGYGFSVLGAPAENEEFDPDSFKHIILDWGWSGADQERPRWLAKP